MGTYEYKYEIHANGSADEEEIVDALCEAGLYEVTVEKTLDIQAFINMQSNAPDDTLSDKWQKFLQTEGLPHNGISQMVTELFEKSKVKSKQSLANAIYQAYELHEKSYHMTGLHLLKVFQSLK